MSNSGINKPGLEYLRDASDRLAADSIRKLKEDIAKALKDFGCMAPDGNSSDWFHAEGKAILTQLASSDPSSDWPFWIWDRCTNKVLQNTESSLIEGSSSPSATEFSAMSFAKVSTSITLGNVPDERNFTVDGSVGESLGGEHVQVLRIEAEDGEPIPDFTSFDLDQIKKAIKAKSEEEEGGGE